MALFDRLKSALVHDFEPVITPEPAANIDLSYEGQRIINFVWLRNRMQSAHDFSDPLPEKYLRNLLETARTNPDCQILLWFQSSQWNPHSKRVLSDLCRNPATPNLRGRSLSEIPEYCKNSVFRKTHKGFYDHTDPIWLKVDYARVLVLSHLLETTQAEQVFYSDLDIAGPQISSPEIQNIIQQHGMVFARDNRSHGFLENQFMGFSRETSAFVSQHLVISTGHAIRHGADGWMPLCQCAHSHLGNNNPQWLDSVTIQTMEI